jgi:hypothetical protein
MKRPDTSLMIPVLALALCLPGCRRSRPAQDAASTAPGSLLQGKVLEVLPAPPYTYLRLETASGEAWAAVPATDVRTGSTVTVQVQIHQDTFESPSLHRTFHNLAMGTLPGAGPSMGQPAPAAGPAPGPAAHGAPAGAPGEKVERATDADAHTIAELFAQKASLKGRTVTVRGKVAKISEGILGKTWIHLHDGTGSPATRDFDLTVTTQDAAKLGDVVTVKGVLHVDRDFGTGFAYPVVIEDGRIRK